MKQQNTLHQDNKIRLYLGSTLLFIGIFSTATVAGLLILLSAPFSFLIGYKISALWCRLVLWMAKVFCGLSYEVEGLEHVNKNQAVIVLSNHQSAWETLALRHILPTQVVLLKRSLTLLPVWGWALGTLKSIAIDRNNQRTALRILLEKGTAYLKQGLWVIIFPEGTRTKNGETQDFKSGIGALVAGRDVGVFPCYLDGTFNAWPKGSRFPRPKKVRLVVGEERNYAERAAEKSNISSIAAELRDAVDELGRKNGSH